MPTMKLALSLNHPRLKNFEYDINDKMCLQHFFVLIFNVIKLMVFETHRITFCFRQIDVTYFKVASRL